MQVVQKKILPDENLGDHTETIEIVYDPRVITYTDLLDVFWQSHEPTVKAFSRQYMSIIFYHSEEQRELVQRTARKSAEEKGPYNHRPCRTFLVCRRHHQKYYLRNRSSVMKEFEVLYPSPVDFVNSTAAARVNGFLGGNGTSGRIAHRVEEPQACSRND